MSNERLYYDTLQRISKSYATPDRLRRNAARGYGLDYEEALEMSYENIQSEAKQAIKGKKRPAEGTR